MSELPELVQSLLSPEAYPEAVASVDLVQTQMSFVFLTGDYVYKVKKPVDLGYLDYTTLEKRLFYCQREVELNGRLCPGVYLGVVPLTRKAGRIVVGGEGETIEYAVRMRYLPQEAMLDSLLVKNQVSPEMLTVVAQKLAEFHRKAATSDAISAFGEVAAIKVNTDENFSQTEAYISRTISAKQYRCIKDYTNSFLKDNVSLFRQRVGEGRIKDCHGDLHAAHVCFTDSVCIYDCIEFNDRFRYGDVASEIALLAMDLDRYGRADLSASFVADYVAFSRDEDLDRLLNFYKCYRAYVRGKVVGFKLDDPYVPEGEKEKALAAVRRYFALAESYL